LKWLDYSKPHWSSKLLQISQEAMQDEWQQTQSDWMILEGIAQPHLGQPGSSAMRPRAATPPLHVPIPGYLSMKN
jgi:hypothetical protein